MTALIVIRVRVEGVEQVRALGVVRRMWGVSVVDADHGDAFAETALAAVDALCTRAGWELVGYVATRAPDDGGAP